MAPPTPKTRPRGPAPSVPTVYTVRISPRARRVTLRMGLRNGLVVVVPQGFDLDAVPALVQEKAAWIARVQTRLDRELDSRRADPPDRLPLQVALPAVSETWTVQYVGSGGGPSARSLPDGVLRVSGHVEDPAAVAAALRRWLSRRAREHLVPWLDELCVEHGFAYRKVSVRSQATRWGSCSRRSDLSLNRSLLFLPPELARYVLLHELCHTVRLDHSPRFWAEVRRHEPDCDRLRGEMRTARRLVPGWATGGTLDSSGGDNGTAS